MFNKKSLLALGLSVAMVSTTAAYAADKASLVSTNIFPNVSLKSVSNEALINSVSDDQGVNIGGLGSDIYRIPGSDINEFYLITDRGPNNDTTTPAKEAATGFVVPSFSPIIMKVRLTDTGVEVLSTNAITTKTGAGVTGLPNVKGYDAIPSDVKGITSDSLYNVNGLDTEGIVKLKNGNFWVVEEYAPSLVQLSSKGVVKNRFVPTSWAGKGSASKITKSIPEIFLKRKANRGFEAIAVTPDEKTLFIGLQSPLLNPSSSVGNASLITRVLRFNILTKQFTGEFIFPFEKVSKVDPTSTKNSDLKLSAMVALNSDTLLVQERTDNSFLVSTVKIKESSNILGTKWDDIKTNPSLESLTPESTEISALVTSLEKKILFSSLDIAEMPKKIEGMSVLDAQHILFINDNDFNFSYNSTTGKVDLGTTSTKLLKVKLAAPLPTFPDASIAHIGGKCVVPGSVTGNLICRTSSSGEFRWLNK